MTTERSIKSDPAARAAAMAALIAPLVFAVLVVAQGLRYPDYSHQALPISALAAWPHGWVQTLNFLALASGMFAFALALHRGIAPDRTVVAGPMLLATSGLGLILAAAFPWSRIDGAFAVPPGHLAGAALTFVGASAGFIVIARRMRRDPRWRDLASYTLMSGVIILVLSLATMAFARTEGAPLHPWLGLLQRVMLLVWFPCMMILSRRVVLRAHS
jgi:hypothetical membrane protein